MAEMWPEVAEGKPAPLYGVFGEEDFLLNQALVRFSSSPAFAANPSLNQERFWAAEIQPGKVLDSANTLPFLGTRRLIMVHGIDAWKAEALNQFIAYFENPAPATCLVFSAAKLDARGRFAKALQKHGKVQQVRKPYPRELPAWLQSRARMRGKNLGLPAARLLMEMGDLGLMELDQEIEKICLFAGNEKELSVGAVKTVLGQGRLFSVFDLTNAIARCDLARGLSALEQLLAVNEAPIAILGMITRLFRQLGEVRQILDSGGNEGSVQQSLRTPPQVTSDLVKRAAQETPARLAARLEDILHADIALKSSATSDKTIMHGLVFKLCQRPG